MAKLSLLFEQMKFPDDPLMRSDGYALWLTWQGELNPVVSQSMQDYGGLAVREAEGQSLWFFFSSDAFLSAARLETWARFNSLAVSVSIMPAVLLLGDGRGLNVDTDPAYKTLEIADPASFQTWVSAACRDAASGMPGITLVEEAPPGLAGSWLRMQADARLPYQASLGWYAVLHPLGNPLDKSFQSGWRCLFEEVEKILQRRKFRYTIHDFFLMFPLESLREFKAWTGDYLALVARLQEEKSEAYWPCALVTVDKKSLPFNNDLPKKIPLDWDQLAADYPHMSFRNALLLGPDYMPHEVRFASGKSPDAWCNVSLVEKDSGSANSLPLLVPGNLVLGKFPQCFYCGQRSHESSECPTRIMGPRDKDIWKRIAALDMSGMKEGVRSLDEAVAAEGVEVVHSLIQQDSLAGVVLRAIYDIDGTMQVRSINAAWRARGKLPPGIEDPAVEDNTPIWEMLGNFASNDKPGAEKALNNLAVRFPRDFRPRSLNGFVAMERGDFTKALAFWKEAEGLSPVGFLQAWHLVLQGRVHESQGRFSMAIALYEQAARQCPQWLDPVYRKVVSLVKTGFADKGFSVLYPLMEQDPHYFNRALLDTEMERGQIQILTSLSTVWSVLESRMQEERPQLERLHAELASWFQPDHPFYAQASERIKRLLDMTKYRNYVPYQAAINARMALERDMSQLVLRETREFRNRFKGYTQKLAHIRDEAAWFPFPKVMVEFNKNYNKSVENLNWAMQANMGTAETFRKAQEIALGEKERIRQLEKRLAFLRLIRDITLFLLTFLRSFFWMEVAGLLLVLVALPLTIFYGEKTGSDWVLSIPDNQRWQIQKLATLGVSLLAFAVSLLRTLFRFDKVRDKLLSTARSAEKQRAVTRTAKRKK